MRRLLRFVAFLATAMGTACGDDAPPIHVLSSLHFRLFFPQGAPVSTQTLDRLEMDYRDIRAFLHFPESRIDYHLFSTTADAARSCVSGADIPPEACTRSSSVYTTNALDHHELIHAYMAPVGAPPPLFQEGVAEGLNCGPTSHSGSVAPWRTTVTLKALHQPEVYQAGLELFVYLIRTFGAARFVDYYGVAADTADPQEFQRSFEAFWGISLDSAWEEMQHPRKANGRVFALCPCTQPGTLPLDGTALDLAALDTDIVPLPLEPGPFLFSATVSATLSNCSQDYLSFKVANLPTKPLGITAARLLPERHFFSVDTRGSLTASVGNFVSATCADAQVIPVPPNYAGAFDMVVARGPDYPLTSDWYTRLGWDGGIRTIRVRAPDSPARGLEVCPSCAATGATTCTQIPAVGGDVILTVGGPEFVLHATYALLPEGVASSGVTFLPAP